MEKQIISNRDFLNILKDKLTKGNKKSIHLNVLPRNSATRVDLKELELINKKFSEKFISKLLKTPNFKIELAFDSDFDFNELDESEQVKTQKALRRLKSICKQNKDYFFEHGIEPFGFGFPIIYKRDKTDPKSVIKAPLIIWSLEIEENRQYSNKWIIKREEDFPIYFNDVLISHIERDENVKIAQISYDFLEDSIIDRSELLQLTEEFLSRFGSNLKTETINEKIFNIKHSETLLEKVNLITEKPVIIGGGVFGLYINQKQSIIEDVKNLSEKIETYKANDLILENLKINPFSSVSTDPSQQSVLSNITNNQRVIIHGPPGTGKSQTLTAIITNALSNKAKCLIVCEKRTALDVIYNNLKDVGLDQLCALIEDTSKDRRKIVDKARETIDNVLQTQYRSTDYRFNINKYKQALSKIKQNSLSLNKLHNAIDKKILGDSNWSILVGEFLKITRSNLSFNLLEQKMPNELFAFNKEEYLELLEIVKKAEKLFLEYNELESKLEILNFKKFINKQFLDIKAFFDVKIQEYLNSLDDNIENISKILGKTYNKYIIAILSIFSKKYKKIRSYYKSYIYVLSKLNSSEYFKDVFNREVNYGIILKQLLQLKQDLLGLAPEKGKINSFVEWHNFKSNLTQNQQILINIIIKHSNTFIETFKAWYINRLLNVNYIPKIPNNDSLPDILIPAIEEFKNENTKKALHYWQEKRIESIYRYNNRNKYLNAKQLYAKVGRNEKKKSLRQIIKTDFELFTDIFPVMLVNPSVCSSLFDLKENLFDIVIFDEASQLRIEDTFCALIRGRIKVISGDEHQMPPSSYFISTDYEFESDDYYENDDEEEQQKKDAVIDLANKESLLEYAADLNYFDTYLDIHYRSKHPDLIEFSNAAFYSNRLTPMPAFDNYKPIRFVAVNGNYENQVNILEAKQVIQILKDEVKENSKGVYPSIGIATFNIHQRNLIWDLINKESKVDTQFGNKIEKIFENGLFIKNLENIQGDERDIIIISTTFGLNKNGVFSERFGPLNIKTKGHRLLNVIITRAKYQLFICTSFPLDVIQQYKEHITNMGNIGKGVLYAYLAYARAIEDNDSESKAFILNLLSQNGIQKAYNDNHKLIFGTESPFEEEVVESLINNGISHSRIELQYKCGGFRIDIVIKSILSGKPAIAIECDGTVYHSSNEAYVWDTFRQKQLEQYGFKFYRIWSTNWWQDQETELKSLLNFIHEFDLKDKQLIQISKHIQLSEGKIKVLEKFEKTVAKNSKVKLLNLISNEEIVIRFSNQKQLKINPNDKVQTVYEKSPIAKAVIGNKVGDICEIEHSGELFKILEII